MSDMDDKSIVWILDHTLHLALKVYPSAKPPPIPQPIVRVFLLSIKLENVMLLFVQYVALNPIDAAYLKL